MGGGVPSGGIGGTYNGPPRINGGGGGYSTMGAGESGGAYAPGVAEPGHQKMGSVNDGYGDQHNTGDIQEPRATQRAK